MDGQVWLLSAVSICVHITCTTLLYHMHSMHMHRPSAQSVAAGTLLGRRKARPTQLAKLTVRLHFRASPRLLCFSRPAHLHITLSSPTSSAMYHQY